MLPECWYYFYISPAEDETNLSPNQLMPQQIVDTLTIIDVEYKIFGFSLIFVFCIIDLLCMSKMFQRKYMSLQQRLNMIGNICFSYS